MSETRYIISDASKMIDVEPHVLRYWEEELGMEIPRNELGHRYYTDKEVHLFTMIRDLKEKGFQLKAIKMILSAITSEGIDDNIISLEDIRKNHDTLENDAEIMQEDVNERHESEKYVDQSTESLMNTSEKMEVVDKIEYFKYMLDDVMTEALEKNNKVLESSLTEHISDHILKEMDYLLRMQEEREEQRYRNIDDLIRKKQKGHKEAAATKAPAYDPLRPKKKWFKNREF